MPDELVTYTEAAAMCGVPEETVRQWRSRRYLTPAGRIGRRLLFRPAEVRAANEAALAWPGGRKRKSA